MREITNRTQALKRRSRLLTAMLLVEHLQGCVWKDPDGLVCSYIKKLTENSNAIREYNKLKSSWLID